MPLYEYECRDCGHRFEAFVTSSKQPQCPSCQSRNLEKQISVFGVGPAGGSYSPGSKSSCSSGGG